MRGEHRFNPKYVDSLCNRLVRSPDISGVFASIEKDRLDEHNHLHLLIASSKTLSRYKLCRLSHLSTAGIGNVEMVHKRREVAQYVCKHIGKDFSYHNIYIN
tara:strand:+ start:321 stop:626 length:306 start_codon:yes stop_codon:yes gene_type:complete